MSGWTTECEKCGAKVIKWISIVENEYACGSHGRSDYLSNVQSEACKAAQKAGLCIPTDVTGNVIDDGPPTP